MPFKQIPIIIAFLFTLFAAASTADAAEVYKKTSNLISSPQVSNNKVYFNVSGTVKLVRHAKYLTPEFSKVDVVGSTKATSRITGFSYNCPGYYTTRIYSDVNGLNMIGYVQVYVSDQDIKNSSCKAITKPPTATGGNTTPITPPTPMPTHPIPSVQEVFTQSTYVPQIAENFEPTPKPPPEPELTFNQYCQKYINTDGMNYSYKQMPGTDGQSLAHCCPTYHEIFKIQSHMSSDDYWLWDDVQANGWGCGVLHIDTQETYCAAGQVYNSTTGKCNLIQTSGDPGNFPLSRSSNVYKSEYVGQGSSEVEHELYNAMPEEQPDPPEEQPDPPEEQPDPPIEEDDPIIFVEGSMLLNACKVPGTSTYELKLKMKDFSGNIFPVKTGNAGFEWTDYHSMEKYVIGENNGDLIIDINNDPNVTFQMYSYGGGHNKDHEFISNILTGSQILASAECGSENETETGESPTSPTEPTEPTEPTKPDCYCEKLDNFGAGLGFLCCVWDCPGLDEMVQDFKTYLSDDLVGTATAPPVPEFDPPQIPNIFDVLNDVDKRQPEPITHENPPGLEDAGFTADDVKMNADEIQFRDDPTGGFNITNPMDSLPEDGSTAPKPDSGTVNYPSTGSGNGSSTSGTVNYPKSPGGTATPPSTDGTATQPSTGGNIPYPTGD